jgi:hypothetical protein
VPIVKFTLIDIETAPRCVDAAGNARTGLAGRELDR